VPKYLSDNYERAPSCVGGFTEEGGGVTDFTNVVCWVQFIYMLLVGTFPFNSFLAGFFCCVGFFVLTGEFLRGQEYGE